MTGLNVDVNHVFYIAAAASIYYLIRKHQIEFDFSLALLCTTMVFVAIIDYHTEDYIPVSYAWILPTAYILGKLIVGTDWATINEKIVILYFSMALPMYIQSVLDIGSNWKTGWALGTERWPEFWTGEIEPRTTYEMGFVLTTSAFAFAFYIFRKHSVAAITIIAANMLLQYMVMHVQGRQNPVLLILTILIVGCLMVYDRWHGDSRKFIRFFGIALLVVVLMIALVAVLFATNAFGLMDIYRASYWADGGFLKNERIDINLTAFKSMLKWPNDNYTERAGLDRAHSMVLEYGRVYDMTVYIGLTIIRLMFIFQALRMALAKNSNSWIKYLIVPAFVSLNLYYTMEPNAYAHRYLWMPGLFVSGMIAGWLELKGRVNEK